VCTLGVLWADGQADAPTREGVLNSIQTELDTRKLFDNANRDLGSLDAAYQPVLPTLRGMVSRMHVSCGLFACCMLLCSAVNHACVVR
jgi:hypothetical protein